MFTVGEIIDLAIRIEKNGEEIYRKAWAGTSDPSLAAMLRWLADEETEHEKWFIRLKGEIEKSVSDPQLEKMGEQLLGGILGNQAFSIEDVDFSKIENMRTLLALSIEFEKDTILFFEMLCGFIDDDKTADQLEKIIEEERRHVGILEEYLETKKPLPVTD